MINSAPENRQKKIVDQETVVDQDKNNSSAASGEKESDELCKVGQLEDRIITGVERNIDDSECFKAVRKGGKVKAGVQ